MPPSAPTGPPAQEQEWQPPLVFDEYQLLWMLGRGGMGAVYLGHDKLLDRPVAIKFLSSVVRDQKLRERYLTEARTAARLQHSNVVTIHRVGEIDGRLYIVTEYVRGQTLDSLAKPMPWQHALELGLGLARGLAEAHRRGVLHRDIKPGNAILADTGETKLLDFGLAKFLENSQPLPSSLLPPTASSSSDSLKAPTLDFSDPQTAAAAQGQPGPRSARVVVKAGRIGKARWVSDEPRRHDGRSSGGYRRLAPASSIKGTPMYMAPEVLSGMEATRRSDIYSMGALLFELAAGVPPHYDVPLDQLMSVVPHRDAPPLSHIAPGIDPRFAAVIDRCLRRNPGERFATGELLLEALEHIAPSSSQSMPEGNPYRGLWPFDAEHRSLYFGRRGETGTVLERLRSEPGVLVAGDSGVGKSSFCQAGLLPLVQDGLIEQTREWMYVCITPGRQPFRRLLDGLAAVLRDGKSPSGSTVQWEQRLQGSPETLAEQIDHLLPANKSLLLLIDQLEEILAASTEELQKFARAIGSLHRMQSRWRLIASLRSTHIAKLAAVHGMAEWIDSSLYRLRPLSLERLREAITGPAHAKGFLFQSQVVVDQLAEQTALHAGGLPLLALTLAELWEARVGNAISETALAAIGGLSGAITRHADHVLGTLLGERRQLARRLLCALGRPHTSLSLLDLGAEDAPTHSVLETLVRSRLVFERATPDGPRYELAHAALYQSWPTLQRWMSDPRVSDPSQPAISPSTQSLPSAQPRRRVLLALLGSGIAATAAYGVHHAHSMRARTAQVAQLVKQAQSEIQAARDLHHQQQILRERSLQAFIDRQIDEALHLQAEAHKDAQSADRAFARAGNQLETALHIEGTQEALRTALANVLHERAIVAEAAQQEMLLEDLLQRLALHDTDGSRRQLWQQPARLSLTSSPHVTSVHVMRYREAGSHAWQEQGTWSLGTTPIPKSELQAGAYVLRCSAPGFQDRLIAVLLSRGSERSLQIVLPKQGSTP